MADAVVARCVEHLDSLPTQPLYGVHDTEALCRQMREPAPAAGTPLDGLLDDLFTTCTPHSFDTPSPGYLAYIPGGGLFAAAPADFLADTANRSTGIWQAAPSLVQLGADIRLCVSYTSDQVHHCVNESAKLAGTMPDRVHTIATDTAFRLSVDALREAIAADRAAGLLPFMVVSTAGTTNTGAVDPLNDVADLCAAEGLWYHVDGAYGGFFRLCDDTRAVLRGLERADSLTRDPHKGMVMPYGTGALLVRDGALLRAAHAATAGYLPDAPDAGEFYDPSQHGPDLSRGFPGPRMWLTITLHGADAFRAAITEKRAVEAARRVAALPHVVMDAPPELSLFAFHLSWPGATLVQEDAATRMLMDATSRRGRVMVSGAVAGGRYLGHVCVLSLRTYARQIDHLIDDMQAAMHDVLPSTLGQLQ